MNRHPLDLVSLIPGLAFVLIAAASLVRAAPGDSIALGLRVPLTLVAVGVAGLVGALRGAGVGSSDSPDEQPPPAGL